jgi:hypothetical protein
MLDKPISHLTRITTEYVDTEDRFRITGQVEGDEVVEVWLTQRLFTRVLPHYFKWLEEQSTSTLPKEIEQSFAQHAAKADLPQQSPVQHQPNCQKLLVQAIDISSSKEALGMRFKSSDDDAANLSLPATQLRQWLTIVRTLWQTADWPMGIWPEWMTPSESQTVPHNKAVH